MGLDENTLPLSIQSQFNDKDILFQIQTRHNVSNNDMQRGLIGIGFLCVGLLIMILVMYFQGADFTLMRKSMTQAIREQPEILYSIVIFFIFFLGIPTIPLAIIYRKRYYQPRKRYIGTQENLNIVYKEDIETIPWEEISPHILSKSTPQGESITLFKRNKDYEKLEKAMGKNREILQKKIMPVFLDPIAYALTKQQEKYICGYIEGIDEETITQIQKLLSTP